MWEMKPDGDGTQQDTFWERNRLNFDTKEHGHFFFSSQVVFSDSFGIILLVQSSIYYIRNTLSHCIFLSAPYARLSLGHFLMSAVKSWW